MTESKTRTRIGITWYNRSDYHAILEIMEDSDLLPSTFERWQGYAARRERREQRAGRIVVRAYANPREFAAWCIQTGQKADANARRSWAQTIARQSATQHSKHYDQPG